MTKDTDLTKKIMKTKLTIIALWQIFVFFAIIALFYFVYNFINLSNELDEENKSISFSYLLGSFFGAFAIPILLLLIWRLFQIRLNDLIFMKSKYKKDKITNHFKYGSEFEIKLNSLNDLFESKIIDKNRFDQNIEKIVDEYFLLISQEEKKIKDKELVEKLKTALELGTISQIEYEEKLKINLSESSNVEKKKPKKNNYIITICILIAFFLILISPFIVSLMK
jgi:hypothetical protein